MLIGTEKDYLDEDYENLAEFVAHRYGRSIDARLVRDLLCGYRAETIEQIECNPQDFNAKVESYVMLHRFGNGD